MAARVALRGLIAAHRSIVAYMGKTTSAARAGVDWLGQLAKESAQLGCLANNSSKMIVRMPCLFPPI